MKRTKQQNKRLHKLLGELQIDAENKAQMVSSFTKGRTEHTSEMYYAEAQRMIEKLEEMSNKTQERQENELKQRLRRSVFRLMYDIGFLNSSMTNVDKIAEIHAFMRRKTKFQRHFNNLTTDELTTLINQLQAIRRNYQQSQGLNVKLN